MYIVDNFAQYVSFCLLNYMKNESHFDCCDDLLEFQEIFPMRDYDVVVVLRCTVH